MFKKYQHIHFVGIGGIGMSGIAEVLLNLGYRISGSDAKRSSITDRLERLGARVFEGHAAAHIEGAHVVVTSTAVRPDNPEVAEAMRKQIPVIPRAEMLAELMRLKYGVAIAGSHGKTTTTSMAAVVLDRAGLDPTIVVGGRVNTLGSNAKLGRGDFMVVEADESDKSFLKLSPTIAVVTNIDLEHLDFYSGIEEIRDHFVQFVNKVPFYGSVIICLDDPNIQMIIPQIQRRVITYGMRAHAEISASDVQISRENFGSTFTVRRKGEALGTVKLNVPGEHNVCNALAVVAVGLELEVEFAQIAAGLAAFTGAGRRFEIKGLIPAEPGADERAALIQRLQGYMEKATHEAKQRTSWINPHAEYDAAVRRFVADCLTPGPENAFLNAFQSFHRRIVDACGERSSPPPAARRPPRRGAAARRARP